MVEGELKSVVQEVEDLKAARDRSQISDLVLLERLKKTEGLLGESLGWIKKVADAVDMEQADERKPVQGSSSLAEPLLVQEDSRPAPLQNFLMPRGEAGSLASITTPTELQVLALLSEQGPKSAPEIGHVIGRSREHSARLMKKLFEEGYVRRDQVRIPFRYSVVERVRASFKKPEKEEAAQQEAAVQA